MQNPRGFGQLCEKNLSRQTDFTIFILKTPTKKNGSGKTGHKICGRQSIGSFSFSQKREKKPSATRTTENQLPHKQNREKRQGKSAMRNRLLHDPPYNIFLGNPQSRNPIINKRTKKCPARKIIEKRKHSLVFSIKLTRQSLHKGLILSIYKNIVGI